MNTQLKSPRAVQPKSRRLRQSAQSAPIIDHAEIVRMAVVEAAYREAERHEMIAKAAYFRAQQRGFEPGHELEDWFAAEDEIVHSQQLSILMSGADAP